MSLHQKIQDDLKESLKSGDSFRTGTLRLLISALHNKEIEKKGKGQDTELKDEDVIEILNREAKKRKEAFQVYSQNNRSELADKEKKELGIIEGYLPAKLSDEETEKIVSAVLERMPEEKNFGKIMGEAMKELKGKADAGVVGEIIKKKLG